MYKQCQVVVLCRADNGYMQRGGATGENKSSMEKDLIDLTEKILKNWRNKKLSF